MKRALSALICAAAILLTAAAPLQPISGEWDITRSKYQDGINLRLTFADDSQSEHFRASDLGLNDARVYGTTGQARFTLQRDAGTAAFEGTLGGGSGSGTFTFTPNGAFADGLAQRGFGTVTNRNLLTSAMVDLTLPYVDSIHAAGYPQIRFEDIVAFRALGVTPASIAQMRGLFGQVSAQDMIPLAALHITKSYVDELRSIGVGEITARRAIEFKAVGVTKAYVADLAQMGYPNLAPDQIVTFRAMHIDRAYLAHLAQHGLTHLTAQQVIQLKATGL